MTAMTQVPVLCRNQTAGPLVIASDPKSTHEVIFSGLGDPGGGDVQPVPEELLRTPQFAKTVAMGLLKVEAGEDHEAVRHALQVQTDAFWKRAAQEKDAAMATLETAPDNDMIAIQCIGPGTRPDTRCEDTIPVRVRERDAVPPLCTRHAMLLERCVRRGAGAWTLES
jgi:hypothetical protein